MAVRGKLAVSNPHPFLRKVHQEREDRSPVNGLASYGRKATLFAIHPPGSRMLAVLSSDKQTNAGRPPQGSDPQPADYQATIGP
ncbi:unnamed protein product [marine sediment metagenome]|uniref:Uncharacterized protein n=1 Tax=marine sediment metagenome TaxID=412755 RepID=X1I5X9_9ZZZZ